MGKFNKGLFLGGLLGAGAMWLNTTDKGKQLRKKFLDHSEKVYDQAKEKVKNSETYQDLSEKDFKQIVEEVTEKYGSKTDLSSMTKKIIIKLVSRQWDGIQAEIKEKKEDEDKDEKDKKL